MKLSNLKRDVNSAENGVWITNAYGDIDLFIASHNNSKYLEMLRSKMKPYKRTYQTMADEVFEEIENKCLAKTVLLGWRNMETDESTEENPEYIEYSTKKAFELLSDPENIEFRKLVIDLSDEAEVFRKEVIQETADKS